jgi:GNAT superfamily N-acetyltransferase
MISLLITDSTNIDFISLVRLLDAELAERDGAEHKFYATYNGLVGLDEVVLAYSGEKAVGCGALKAFEEGAVEVKRMYVLPAFRGKGVAGMILARLERQAAELGNAKCVLETGLRQPEAIALYSKNGYVLIPNYGPYHGVENSRCFEKYLHM